MTMRRAFQSFESLYRAPDATQHVDPNEALRMFHIHGDGLVLRTAIWSRVLVACVGTLALVVVGPYDSSTTLLLGGGESAPPVMYPLACSANWDGAYFTRIAQHGYIYEQAHAFFPLMPFIMRTSKFLIFDHIFTSTVWFPTDAALLSFAGALISNAAFVVSALILFRLGDRVLNNSTVALRASLLFCFNPASIFFSVAYAESIFALLVFSGMLVITPQGQRSPKFRERMLGSLLFGLATTARSNGALLGLHSLYAAYRAWRSDARSHRTLRALIELSCVTAVHLSCLLAVLGYGWLRFCYWPATVTAPWCSNTIPNIYSYIEEKYWEVAPFQYYQQKQIPNFILAMPIIIMSLRCIRKFRWQLPVYSIQLGVSVIVSLVMMNVQVSTRLICASCPVVYWFAARATAGGGGKGYFTLLFFSLYTILGSGMFCAYYPWT